MSGWAISSAMFAGFTEPPYWMRTRRPPASPTTSATTPRIGRTVAWASSGVAVRPVPMAQIGS